MRFPVARPRARLRAALLLATVVAAGAPAAAAPTSAARQGPEVGSEDGVELRTVLLGPARSAGRAAAVAAPGFDTSVRTPIPAQMVGFTWDGAPTGAVRVRPAGGRWIEVEANPDEAPDASSPEHGSRTGAGPVWLGEGVERVDVAVEHGSLADLRMAVIRSTGGWSATEAATAPMPAVGVRPTILPREAWGAGPWRSDNAGCGTRPLTEPARIGILHHTATGNAYGPDEADDLLRGIYAFHTQTQGWCDIAYNILVDRYGRAWEGRSGGLTRGVVGGHSKGFNTGSFGVSLLGDHSTAGVPAAAAGALRAVFAWKFAIHGIDAGATRRVRSGGSTKYAAGQVVTLPTLLAHRDVSLTSCPGDYGYPLLPGMRLAVQGDVMSWAPYPLPRWRRARDRPRVLTLDALGGLHPAGSHRPVAHSVHWGRWGIARGAASDRRGGGYVLDGFGGVHPYGDAPRVGTSAYWGGTDVARGIAASGRGRGWVLHAYGGLHRFGSARAMRTSPRWPGFDIARGVASLPAGGGGYVLDGFGGVHAFGRAPRVRTSEYWPGWDIARAIATRPDGRGGYVLDGLGGIHPFGGAPRLATSFYTGGPDLARGLVLTRRGSRGFVVDAWGRLWPVGSASDVRTSLTWRGLDLARGIVVSR